ncbi:MAG: hypothetical protein E6Q93_16110 [Burkholderiaceae bacterium]|nr:MAG: hypothetical protein E6Q93_16110 [Burkholderiaceae bacterium]
MTRLRKGLIAFGLVGGLAAASVSERGSFVVAFFWLMFGGIAGLLAMMTSAGERGDRDHRSPAGGLCEIGRHPFSGEAGTLRLMDSHAAGHKDAFVDENGVQRYPGDVFDFENHPTPGAHSRI